jgi:predicted ATPase
VPAEQAVDAFLREREAFLVLDNFEQLLDAAPWVSSLLAAAPRLRVLVTSRAVLRVAGEREYEVPPLEDGAELFVRRAPAPVDDLESVRAICIRLDGLPLAIELAAARTKLLAPAALLERLESRLELLTSGTRDAPERQRTMRAAIDWSYRLLAPDEQVLFARLAAFAGEASLEAVERVCGTGLDALETLASLVDKSLVRRRGDGDPRFGMLETLREYAGEQLRALGEEDALRARHLALHVTLARDAESGLEGPRQDEWLARLESALPDVRAALAYALERADAEAAVTIAAGLRRFWHVHGHLEEGQRWLEVALASGEAPPAAVEKAWAGLGIMLGDRGDLDGSRRAFERSLELARALGDDGRVASALNNLGTLAMFAGRYEDAQRLYEQVLAVHRRRGSAHGLAGVLENLGSVALVRGDAAAAAAALDEARTHARRLDEARAASSAARWLARALVRLGELDRARELLLESLELAQQIGHRQGLACAVDFTAAWAAATGDAAAAARLLGAGEGLFASIGATRLPDVAALDAETEREVRAAIGAEAFEAEAEAGRVEGQADAVRLALDVLMPQ